MGDECRLASSEYQINGERRNLDVLINGYLERGYLLFSFSPYFHGNKRSQFARIFLNGQSHFDRVNRVNNNVGNRAHSDLPSLPPCFPRIYQSEKPGLKRVRREKNSIKPRQVFTSPSSLEGDYLLRGMESGQKSGICRWTRTDIDIRWINLLPRQSLDRD